MHDEYFFLKICTPIRMFALTTMKQNVKDIHTRKSTFNIVVYGNNTIDRACPYTKYTEGIQSKI